MLEIILIIVLSISILIDFIYMRLNKKLRKEQSKFNQLITKSHKDAIERDRMLDLRIDGEIDRVNKIQQELLQELNQLKQNNV